jgi:hypothetical protein
MPYIAAEDRPQYEELIQALSEKVLFATADRTKRAGHLNYIITRVLLETYGRELRYYEHNEIIGILECCKQEFYRRQTAAYEDKCIQKNGDL